MEVFSINFNIGNKITVAGGRKSWVASHWVPAAYQKLQLEPSIIKTLPKNSPESLSTLITPVERVFTCGVHMMSPSGFTSSYVGHAVEDFSETQQLVWQTPLRSWVLETRVLFNILDIHGQSGVGWICLLDGTDMFILSKVIISLDTHCDY